MISVQYGNCASLQQNVCDRTDNFKTCSASTRCRLTGVTIHIHYRVLAVIVSNRRVTIDEVTNHLQISHGFKHEVIGTDQVFVRTVPDGSQASQRRAPLN